MSAHTHWIERLLYPYFYRFIQAHEQSERWTTKRCPACNTPVVMEQANFCHICSASLIPPVPMPDMPTLPVGAVAPLSLTMPVEPVTSLVEPSPTTDALYRLNQRPLQTFNTVRSQGRSIHTAMSAAIDLQKLRKDGKGT
jgi:hypothetical protein